MKWLGRFLRAVAKLRFRLLGLATIKDISGERFKTLAAHLKSDGWQFSSKYEGFDAGIDYDCIRVRKGLATLKCEWDNWSEWSVEGPRRVIENIAEKNNMTVTYAWRWSEYDSNPGGA
ncbi:MAG: hypothetical protein OEW16_07195 [Gammaproteobacteria bacterium]|nr:hypothetical protein [Gammaproteobacteria bacterium]